MTASVAPVTSTTTVASTVTQYDYESPPLPSSSVVFPADDSWTSTYTWSEHQLPVFTAAPDPPIEVAYPTPSTTCLMDSTPTGDSFVSCTAGWRPFGGKFCNHHSTFLLPALDMSSSAMALWAQWNSRSTRLLRLLC